MLDKRSEELLRIINKECSEGSYKVIEKNDLIKSMPNKYKADLDMINQLMGYLANGEYISIKYSDRDVYCVSPLPKGRKIFEVEQEEKSVTKKNKIKIILISLFYLLLIFGACLGASYLAKFI